MSQINRMYKGHRPRSVVVALKLRKAVAATVRVAMRKPDGHRGHQCSGSRVWTFEPDIYFACCNARCMTQFASAEDVRVVAARMPLFDTAMNRHELRAGLLVNWTLHLKFDDGMSIRPVCAAAACKIFVCSKMLLYPDTRKMSRSVSNSMVNSKAARISSWFHSFQTTLDVMPDEGGWFMIQQPCKYMVHNLFLRDCEQWPELYTKISRDYFRLVWRENFPLLRTRKHCRFAKCSFCVRRREIITEPGHTIAEQLEAKASLKLHLAWVAVRERGLYAMKCAVAIQTPDKAMSIALDGTDQFTHGFPHFWRATKDDAKGKRLKIHTEIVMVHGSDPYVFVADESIAADPNFTLHILYKTLRSEELRRGKLPETLYIQMDNCFRENKNSYVCGWLCWLIERGVFKQILVSFLPTGHTHFDPDQFASRLSTATKHQNILCLEKYLAVLRKCYTPGPTVIEVEEVMDVKRLFNPEKKHSFPVGTSRLHQLLGICTKSSPLHWFMRKNTKGSRVRADEIYRRRPVLV